MNADDDLTIGWDDIRHDCRLEFKGCTTTAFQVRMSSAELAAIAALLDPNQRHT